MRTKISLSIRGKLALLAVVCVVGAVALATTAIRFSSTVAETARVINEERFAPLSRLQELSTHLKEVRFRLAGVLLDQMPVAGSRNHLHEAMEKVPELWRQFKAASGTLDGDSAALVTAIDHDKDQLLRFARSLDNAYGSQDRKELERLLEDEWPVVQQKLVKPIDALLPTVGAAVARETAELEATARAFRNFTAAAALAIVVATLVIAWLVIRSLMAGVRQAVGVAQALARGDLTQSVAVHNEDELGQLHSALGETVEQLRFAMGEVRGSTDTIFRASAQIAQGNADLSQRTEEQASTLEETASSMEELTITVAQNASNARSASQLARDASDVALRGGQVVADVVATMSGISESSRKISEIIGVIDGIAFQTNILALNAAVEAARAGEQGRGFAVVAAEVRNLAQRSATAAREIKELIGDSVDRVQAGGRLVDDAGRTMGDVVSAVKQVSELVADIAAASQEQSSGIGQVNTAITQMDQVVQRNAALVEEAAAATESMNAQAGVLLQLVSRFDLGDGGRGNAPVLAVPAALEWRAA